MDKSKETNPALLRTQMNTGNIQKMTPSLLRAQVELRGSPFFSRTTMRFFGDTMGNYGVRAQPVEVRGVLCWVLYRKRPVKHGVNGEAFFSCEDFKQMMRPRSPESLK